MAETEAPKHEINGEEYEYLADGKYDVIICGTGTTECILSGLFAAHSKMKVLHLDRNDFYGAKAASLNLTNLFKKFEGREPTEAEVKKYGSNRDFNVDLVPKFLMANGELVKLLIHTKVTRYLDFKVLDGSYVVKGAKKPKVSKVPTTVKEALGTPLMGFFQKNKLRSFLKWLDGVKPDCTQVGKLNVEKQSMEAVYSYFGLDANTQSFVGHAMGLENDDSYLQRPAKPFLLACRLYGESLARHGNSPFLYPMYGLGGLAEGFARLCAVFGGTFMLHQDIDEIVKNKAGRAIGVRAGKKVAIAPHIVGDPTYFGKEDVVSTNKVIRSICFLDHPIEQTRSSESCQIIIPAAQITHMGLPARTKDVYVNCVSFAHHVAPKGKYIAIVSTEIETEEPEQEIEAGLRLIRPVLKQFTEVCDGFAVKPSRPKDGCHISATYDGTSHFQSVARDVQRIFKDVTGKEIDMSIDSSMEE